MGIGTIKIEMFDGIVRTLGDVRYIPDFKKNLISLGTLDSIDCSISIKGGVIKVTKGAMVIMKGQKTRNLYKLIGNTVIGGASVSTHACSSNDNSELWHKRLGHLSEGGMLELHKRKLLQGVKSCKLDFCKFCVFGKQKRVSFKAASHTSEGVLDYIHSDVWGPIKHISNREARYFVTFIDDFSKKRTPEQNGVAERMNITLLERARCMRLNADLPKSFSAKAVNTTCYLINRSPSSTINHRVPEEEGVKGYRLWDPVAKKKVISRDVVFNEAQMLNMNATSRKRQGHTVEIKLYEQRTKSADESTDGSTNEPSLEDPAEHPSDSWNLVRDREPRSTNFGVMFDGLGAKGEVSGFVDSDYAGNLDSRRSTTGYIFTFYGGLICWQSVLQATTALSTMEAEYMALTEAANEALWLKGLIEELGFKQRGVLLQYDDYKNT
ncbi:hypothetical protein RJ639_046001 [Escallonia herrerae]|uniref:GAG-pre-integrase domain-containing protein n=1 Tax=Escallonia herrerae TaxID=1293975 RepID=A0AA88W873_9ASTE|nr:hypothetical protein RJ639_046001 [Escallonia herrerae]